MTSTGTLTEPAALSPVVVTLLKGVVYRDTAEALWPHLLALRPQVSDYVSVLGLVVVVDEAEGYAFLRSREDLDGPDLPRLIARRSLSFHVSLLLALLRKKLAEFDAVSAETRLVLSRDQIIEVLTSLPARHEQRGAADRQHRQLPDQDRRSWFPSPVARKRRPVRGPSHHQGFRRRTVAGRLRDPPPGIPRATGRSRGRLMEGLFSEVELADHDGDRLPGTRLQRIEVWNWGTFTGRVWTLDLGGRNALLDR